MTKNKPLLLAILDGWGTGNLSETNAVHMADTPNMDRWQQSCPNTTLAAHNGAVGLPEGQMGNSEVGHLNIGAGRVVYQDYTRINRAIETGEFTTNQVLNEAMDKAKANNSALHLLGLVSDGGVHSHLNHLIALIKLAADKGLDKVFIHAFMDGRDTPPKSGAEQMATLQKSLHEIGVGQVASISGRYYAMDRDNRWERVEKAWQTIVEGNTEIIASDPVQAIQDAYQRGETDEFIKPLLIAVENQQPSTINDNDLVIFFNFRADRVRELTHALIDDDFDKFTCTKRPQLIQCVTFTRYEKNLTLPVAFPPVSLTRILGEEISRHELRQLRIAETEKYAHVTYFFNGGREEPFPKEDRILVPSPKEVATYDLKPEMSAHLVTNALLARLDKNDLDLVVLNFANGDMVGHSGILSAAIIACETVDKCIGQVVEKINNMGGVALITADHGNAEMMVNPDNGQPFTAHTTNQVPFIVVGNGYENKKLRHDASLQDIAPTILNLLDLPVPTAMEGTNILIEE